MKQINIDGVIGWDVLTTDIRAEFEAANGEGVDLTISSPGGSVYEGLAIYNVIRDYRRDGGRVEARVIGMAASMATYIPLAADSISIEDNAIWMIHNPWSVAIGDHREIRKQAEVLDGIASVMADAYSGKTGKGKPEIREMMDAETYLYGQEIVDSGFADSMVEAQEDAEEESRNDRESALAFARTSLEAMKSQLSSDPGLQQMDKAAALLGFSGTAPRVEVSRVKADTPEEEGRVAELKEILSLDPTNPHLEDLINAAIEDGRTLDQVQLKINLAHARRPTAEDWEVAKFAGMPIREYLAFKAGEESEDLADEERAAESLGMTLKEFREAAAITEHPMS